MLSTIIVVALLLGLVAGWFVLWATFLRLGLRWAKVEGITTRRIVFATAIVFAVQFLLRVVSILLSPSAGAKLILIGLAELAASVLLSCLIITCVFKCRFLRSMQAWVPTLFASVAIVLFVFLVVGVLLVEPFIVPTNTMAPTLLGDHWRGICPECGRPSFCTPLPPTGHSSNDALLMICEHFHMSRSTNFTKRVFTGDHFLVAKYLKPRRWDIVAFRNPEDLSTLYVRRLAGLPGEEIHIDEGAVWADGNKLKLPESIRSIKYLSELSGWHRQAWGSRDRPAKLAADEYFVVGDFSAQSNDSRFWERGAPGHNPFAVPQSHLCGVVTHIYWPPKRWRILR
jgi:signal peptidase I